MIVGACLIGLINSDTMQNGVEMVPKRGPRPLIQAKLHEVSRGYEKMCLYPSYLAIYAYLLQGNPFYIFEWLKA